MKAAVRAIVGLVIVMLVGVSVLPITLTANAEATTAGTCSPLPVGDELSDEELLAAQGELWWFVIAMVLGGGARAVYENWFDEDYGIDRDDGREIAGTALVCGVGGSCGGTAAAFIAFVK